MSSVNSDAVAKLISLCANMCSALNCLCRPSNLGSLVFVSSCELVCLLYHISQLVIVDHSSPLPLILPRAPSFPTGFDRRET